MNHGIKLLIGLTVLIILTIHLNYLNLLSEFSIDFIVFYVFSLFFFYFLIWASKLEFEIEMKKRKKIIHKIKYILIAIPTYLLIIMFATIVYFGFESKIPHTSNLITNIEIYLFLFLIGWLLNPYEIKNGWWNIFEKAFAIKNKFLRAFVIFLIIPPLPFILIWISINIFYRGMDVKNTVDFLLYSLFLFIIYCFFLRIQKYKILESF